jgi:hypothetical protein
MRALASSAPSLAATTELNRKADLKTRSVARYTHWPNTLEAQRQKKELERRRRLEAIEEAQQAIDDRERQFHEQQRRDTIARANNLMYQENDKVKTFRSSLLVSNALYERDMQAQFGDEYRAREAHARAQHEQQIQESIAKSLARERADAEARDKLAREAAAMRVDQLHEKHARHLNARTQEIRDGELARASAQAAVEQARAVEEARRAGLRVRAEELILANQDAQRVRAEQAKLIDIENAKVAEYAAEKERVRELRLRREAERRAEKQSRVNGIIERQQAHLAGVLARENERHERELAAMNYKEAEKERVLADRRAQLQADLHKGRTLQIVDRARSELRRKQEDEQMGEEHRRMCAELAAQEREEERREREAAATLKSVQMDQIHARQDGVRAARLETMRYAERQQQERDLDDQIFAEYAQHHINTFEKAGKTTMPLKLTLHKMDLKERRLQA